MKILQYCQYVLGLGHFFRSLEISRAFADYEVVLVTGGPHIDIPLPAHVTHIRLPALVMDEGFGGLHTPDNAGSVEAVQESRRQRLWEIYEAEAPDVFFIELYPFGRKAFRFELDPILSAIRNGKLPASKVVCSLRDILVEKKDVSKYEARVIDTLNNGFDLVLIHADARVVQLRETFTRIRDIEIPLVYTGFVAPQPVDDSRALALRHRLGLGDPDKLVVVSAGAGQVGAPLMKAVAATAQEIRDPAIRFFLFCGPSLDVDVYNDLERRQCHNLQVRRFTAEFPAHLAAADLSISMAGYNTCMDILATGVPALVLPFQQNREQGMRAERLANLGALRVLAPEELHPSKLRKIVQDMLAKGRTPIPDIDLNGAVQSARYLEIFMDQKDKTP